MISRDERVAVHLAVSTAASAVPVSWPLDRFVAVNPLAGIVDQGFHRALVTATTLYGGRAYPRADVLGQLVSSGAISAPRDGRLLDDDETERPRRPTFLERTHGRDVTAPSADVENFVAATLRDATATHRATLSGYECRQSTHVRRELRRIVGSRGIRWWQELPEDAADVFVESAKVLDLPREQWASEIATQFARLPGWASWAKWCDQWSNDEAGTPRLSLIELAALLVSCDAAVRVAVGDVFSVPAMALERMKDDEFSSDLVVGRERLAYIEDSFIIAATEKIVGSRAPAARPAAHVVMCIDARSEGLRAQLEKTGPYETLGFAGFFGAPVRIRPLGWETGYDAAPVLLHPDIEVEEVPRLGHEDEIEEWILRERARVSDSAAVTDLSHDASSMFVLAEIAGWSSLAATVRRTLAPGAGTGRQDDVRSAMDITSVLEQGEQWALVAETSLRAMGLTTNFAPLVVLCGHKSSSRANPHAASLDCGACAGHAGGANARVMASLLNDASIRRRLAARELVIPDDTWFVAAEHDTTTDQVTVQEAAMVPAHHRRGVQRLMEDLALATERHLASRVERAPGFSSTAPRAVRRRAEDWAQTRPEWGLAGNAGFVIAPRSATAHLDLEGRFFLHSYDAASDADGRVLETILTAPVVVAQWINAQYYFSTVSPTVFGAGDKTRHNAVGRVGVLEGPEGDLRIGLPEQSIRYAETYVHIPQRLTCFVEAPRSRIEDVIARNPILVHLFDGEWLHLVARDSTTSPWCRRRQHGEWHDLTKQQKEEMPS